MLIASLLCLYFALLLCSSFDSLDQFLEDIMAIYSIARSVKSLGSGHIDKSHHNTSETEIPACISHKPEIIC